jgi:hypothetical protein
MACFTIPVDPILRLCCSPVPSLYLSACHPVAGFHIFYVPPGLLPDVDAAKSVVILAGLHGGGYEQHTPEEREDLAPPGSSTADSGPGVGLFGNEGIDRRYA